MPEHGCPRAGGQRGQKGCGEGATEMWEAGPGRRGKGRKAAFFPRLGRICGQGTGARCHFIHADSITPSMWFPVVHVKATLPSLQGSVLWARLLSSVYF